jgi:hypothetical protein
MQATIDGLTAAANKAKNDDVRAATQALADDYTQILNATKTGNMPEGIDAKVKADAEAFDALCSVGN